MTENGNQCPIWGTYADIIDRPDGRDGTLANSPRAGGQYFIARTAAQLLEERDEHLKARLTSWLIEQRQFGESCPNITSTTIKDAEQRKALRVSERANRILKYVETKTAILGSEVNYRFPASYNINLDNHAIVYWNLLSHSESIGPDDFIFLLNYLAIGRTVLTSALTLSKLETRQQDGEALPGSAMVSLKRPYLQPTSA